MDSITEPTTPAPAGEEEKKPLPENEKLENAEPLPVQPLQPEQPQAQQPVVGVMPASTTRLILGKGKINIKQRLLISISIRIETSEFLESLKN